MKDNSTSSRRMIGTLCILLGLYPVLIATGLFPRAADKLAAPPWIAASAGGVCILAGCMLLLQARPRFVDALASILCLLFGAIGMWVALFSPEGGIAGGVPLLSRETHGTIGRVVFALGSLISFAMSFYALRLAMAHRTDPEGSESR